MFLFRAGKFLRRLTVTYLAGIEIHHVDAHAVFHFNRAKILEMWLPLAVLLKVLGDTFGKKDVACIATIHYALGDIDSAPGKVRPIVDIGDFVYRTAVNAHAQAKIRSNLLVSLLFQPHIARVLRDW